MLKRSLRIEKHIDTILPWEDKYADFSGNTQASLNVTLLKFTYLKSKQGVHYTLLICLIPVQWWVIEKTLWCCENISRQFAFSSLSLNTHTLIPQTDVHPFLKELVKMIRLNINAFSLFDHFIILTTFCLDCVLIYCWNVKSSKVLVFCNMRCFVMFVTAVCVLFLVKLKWPKNRSFYGIVGRKLMFVTLRA